MENHQAVKQLERGREFANQLRGLIFRAGDEEDLRGDIEDLVAKVLDSFTNTLSLFNNNNNHHDSADSSITSSFCHLPASSDESHESPKNKGPTTNIKEQTRSSTRKRTSAHTWVEESKMSAKEDGHAWRKYGQKTILNAKHPRNYFRCTHKIDQGCEALKQVQQIQDDPPLYRITYFGHHTCTNLLMNPHMIFVDDHDLNYSSSARILSFDNNHNDKNLITTFDQKVNNNNNTTSSLIQQSQILFPSAAGSVVKNEKQHSSDNIVKQEKNNNYNNDKINVVGASCSSNDWFLSPDDDEAALFFGSGDDQVDVFDSALFIDPLLLEDPLSGII